MSKIQFTEFDYYPSQLKVLNEAETAEVVGGYQYFYRHTAANMNAYIYSRFNVQVTDIEQTNDNETIQFTIGGKKYSFTDNSNDTSQHNFVLVEL